MVSKKLEDAGCTRESRSCSEERGTNLVTLGERRTSVSRIGGRTTEVGVRSDYDLEFTIMGGGRIPISTILLNELLACIELTPRTRIDSFASYAPRERNSGIDGRFPDRDR
jgi:hypothetical protein